MVSIHNGRKMSFHIIALILFLMVCVYHNIIKGRISKILSFGNVNCFLNLKI